MCIAALLLVIVGSGLMLAGRPASAGAAASSIVWKDCAGGLQCATVRAPLEPPGMR